VVLKVLNSWSVFDTPILSSPLLAASVTHALLIILRNGDVTLFFRTFPFHGLTMGGACLRFATYSRVFLGAKLFVTEGACSLCQSVSRNVILNAATSFFIVVFQDIKVQS